VIVAVVQWRGWGQSAYFEFGRAGVVITSSSWLLGTDEQSWLIFLANLAVTAFAYAAVTGLVVIGEEFGWRGFLQPVLINRFGATLGIFVLGLIWAAWHLPIMIAGYNYPETPFLGAWVLFPAVLIAASYITAWITIKAGSFWPSVLLHGSINSEFQSVTGDKLVLNV
jgi:membrane protease YdiL (CAAX protease family)